MGGASQELIREEKEKRITGIFVSISAEEGRIFWGGGGEIYRFVVFGVGNVWICGYSREEDGGSRVLCWGWGERDGVICFWRRVRW